MTIKQNSNVQLGILSGRPHRLLFPEAVPHRSWVQWAWQNLRPQGLHVDYRTLHRKRAPTPGLH